MANNPGVRITGSGAHRGGGTDDEMVRLFMQALRHPGSADDRIFQERWRQRAPNSPLFGGGGGVGGGELRSAAAALGQAALALGLAARSLSASAQETRAANVQAALRKLGGTHPNRLSVPSVDDEVSFARRLMGGGGAGRLGRGRIPWHHFGLGRAAGIGGAASDVAGLLGIGGLAGGALALIAGLGYEGLRYKTQLGHLAMGFAGEARPYANLTEKLYPLARAGGFSGARVTSRLFPGNFTTPPWMGALGLGPESTADLLNSFGIVPHSTDEAQMYARRLRSVALSPAFAGLPQGAYTQFARQAGALGIELPSGARNMGVFTQSLAGVMTEALTKSLDRAKILQSIEDNLHRMAGGHLGMLPQSLMDFFATTLGRAGPGSRTGAFQSGALQGIAQHMQQIGSNAPITTMAGAVFSGVKSRADIARIVGNYNLSQYDEHGKNPAAVQLENRIIAAARSGRVGAALPDIRELLSAGNGLMGKHVAMNYVGRVFGGGFNGNNPLAFDMLAGLMGYQGAAASFLPQMAAPQLPKSTIDWLRGTGVAGSQTGSTADAAMRAAGISPQLISIIDRQASIQGLNPLLVAGVMLHENAKMNPLKTHKNRNGTTDYGLMQINGNTLKDFPGFTTDMLKDPTTNIAIGAAYLRMHGLAGYNSKDKNYTHEVIGTIEKYFGKTYAGMAPTLGMDAAALQDQMTGAYQSFIVFGQHIQSAGDHLTTFATDVDTAATAVKKFAETLAGVPANKR